MHKDQYSYQKLESSNIPMYSSSQSDNSIFTELEIQKQLVGCSGQYEVQIKVKKQCWERQHHDISGSFQHIYLTILPLMSDSACQIDSDPHK